MIRAVLLVLGDHERLEALSTYCAARGYHPVATSRTFRDAMRMIEAGEADRIIVMTREDLPVESTTQGIRPPSAFRPRRRPAPRPERLQ
jgi:hypothetical protein